MVLGKHVLKKKKLIVWFVALSCIQDSNCSLVNDKFGMCTENKQ